MAVDLEKRQKSNLINLFRELNIIDSKLKQQVAAARARDKYWQNDSIRGLFISETEIEDLLSRKLNNALINDAIDITDDVYAAQADTGKKSGSRLDFLVDRFKLSPFEKDVLLLCMLPELDLMYERLFGYIQDDVTRRKPSVSLALDTLSASAAEKMVNRIAFTPESSLIKHRLIEIQEEVNRKNSPLLSKAIKLDERIMDFMLGFDQMDMNLNQFTRKIRPLRDLESIVLGERAKINLFNLIKDKDKFNSIVIYFWGASGSGKKSTVDALCNEAGAVYLAVNMPEMLASELPLEDAFALLIREAVMQQAYIFFNNFDVLFENDYYPRLKNIIANLNKESSYSGPVFLSGTDYWKPDFEWADRIFISAELSVPGYQERRQIWKSYLSSYQLDNKLAAALSSKFKMNMGQIDRSISLALGDAIYSNGGQMDENNVYDACRRISSNKLSKLAQKINARYIWEDIVLPPEEITQLRELCNHVKYRHVVYNEWGFDSKISLGKGLNALFAGPSGTGKTMAAEIMASELKLDLYKIDLSSVVSKYIGETEKNLNQIFKGAENSNSILFFDEADSLFGKRSEVRDSHDRYANIEIAYLLQKMEEYEGIVILATNLGKNIDEAFARRMHFALEFPFPDVEQRLQIWQKVFPDDAPVCDDVDLQFMSRQFRISGGNIKNISLTAAFLAAAEECRINMKHIILATKREYQKMGKMCTAVEFGSYFEQVRT